MFSSLHMLLSMMTMVLSMILSAIEIKYSLNTLDISSGVEQLVPSLVREFIRLICFALVGKMLFQVFHRTLEFNLLLSISFITASFLAFSIRLTTLFLAALKVRGDKELGAPRQLFLCLYLHEDSSLMSVNLQAH